MYISTDRLCKVGDEAKIEAKAKAAGKLVDSISDFFKKVR